ncbi:hypothetical protein [Spirulina major]|uniref:hypothetical protein n=1 Tax=Spirulina major TaxID=270636 RepID=UPI00093476B6|nr:hypothetical protein [Spirulina major]
MFQNTKRKTKFVFLLKLILVKAAASFIAIFFYGPLLGGLGDSSRYLSAPFKPTLVNFTNRTYFADAVFGFLRIFLDQIQTHLFISLLNGFFIWFIFRKSYPFLNKICFWIAFLLPHFLIWTSSVGKEALVIPGFLLLIKLNVDIVLKTKINYFQVLLSLWITYLVRPNYLISYIFLTASTLLIYKTNIFYKLKAKLIANFLLLIYIGTFMVLALFLTYGLWEDKILEIMRFSEWQFFSYDARTNRLDLDWESTFDFFKHFWWGIPASIIGPTLSEAIQHPLLFPALIEGTFAFTLLFYTILKLTTFSKNNQKIKQLVVFGFIPAVIIGLLSHYPLGILNPGSALRYKQSLAPLFYFYPLLLMARIKQVKEQARSHS